MATFQFLASLPAIQSAIKISGDGNGARIQIDIPESEKAAAFNLSMLSGMVFRVTVDTDE